MRKRVVIAALLAVAMLVPGCGSAKAASNESQEYSVSAENTDKTAEEKAEEQITDTSKDESETQKTKEEASSSEEKKEEAKSEDTYKSDRKSSLTSTLASGEELKGEDAEKAANDFFKSLEGKYDDFERSLFTVQFRSDDGEKYYFTSAFLDHIIHARKCTLAKLDGEKSLYYFEEDADEIYKMVDDGSVIIVYRGNDYDSVENLNNHCGEFHLVDGIEMQATKLAEATSQEGLDLQKVAKSIEIGELPIEHRIDISDDLKAKLDALEDDYNKVDWHVVTSPIDNIVVSEVAYKRYNTNTILVAVTNLGDTDVEIVLKGYPKDIDGADLKDFEIYEKGLGVNNTMIYEVNAGFKTPTGEIVWQKVEAEPSFAEFVHWTKQSYEPGFSEDTGDNILNFVLDLDKDVELKSVFSIAVDENKDVIGYGNCFSYDEGTEFNAYVRYPCDVFDRDKADYAIFFNPIAY